MQQKTTIISTKILKNSSLAKEKLVFVLVLLYLFIPPYFSFAENPAEPYIKKARDHIVLFHYAKARTLLEKAIQLDPKNWEPFYLAGKTLVKEKKIPKAEIYFKKAIELNPSNIDCQKAMASIYIFYARAAKKAGDNDKMINNLHKACVAFPTNTKLWATLMRLYRKTGNSKKIIENGNLIVSSNRQKLSQRDDKPLQEALTIVAQTYFSEGNINEARTFADNASKIRQTNEDLYSLKRQIKNKSEVAADKLIAEAKEKLKTKSFGAALRLLIEAEKVCPSKSGDIHALKTKTKKLHDLANFNRFIDSAVEKKHYESALEIIDNVLSKYPEETSYEKRAASITATIEKNQSMEKAKRRKFAIKRQKKLERIRRYKQYIKDGRNKEKKKKYEIAIISYKQALEISPKNKKLKRKIKLLNDLVIKQKEETKDFNLKKLDAENDYSNKKYESSYNKFIELSNKYPDRKKQIATNIARVCLKLEMLDESLKATMGFEDDKSQQDLYNYINGIIAYKKGDYKTSLAFFEKIKDKNNSEFEGIGKAKLIMYLYKFKIGIIIFLIALLFPIFKFIKSFITKYKVKSKLNLIEKIRENGTYAENLSFLEERFTKEDTHNQKQVTAMYAEALYRTGNFERAFEISRNILKRDARNAVARRIAGECAIQLGDTSPTSIELIQALFKMDESRKDIVTFLAKSYMSLKADHKLAQDFILRYIAISPSDKEPVLYLADLFMKRENYSKTSLYILERAIKISPNMPDFYIGYIENLKKLGKDAEAEQALSDAKAKFPNDSSLFEGKTAKKAQVSPSSYPDYDNIGEPIQTSSVFPDYDSIGEDSPPQTPADSPQTVQASPQTQGQGQIACPHCQALNSLQEYYCSSCGRPLAG